MRAYDMISAVARCEGLSVRLDNLLGRLPCCVTLFGLFPGTRPREIMSLYSYSM